jgi:hypothetical protein
VMGRLEMLSFELSVAISGAHLSGRENLVGVRKSLSRSLF